MLKEVARAREAMDAALQDLETSVAAKELITYPRDVERAREAMDAALQDLETSVAA